MAEARDHVVSLLLQSTIAEWLTTLGLIFGGCCSNAWALELATSQNPHAGSLITFAQFVLVSAYGLGNHVTVVPAPRPRGVLVRSVAARIAELYATHARGGGAAGRMYVAVEGRTSGAFADDLAREIERAARLVPGVKRCAVVGTLGAVRPQLDGVWSAEVQGTELVLVNGEHLHAGEAESRARWTYSVFLVSSGDVPIQDSHASRPGDASLTVDISSQTHPTVISPVPTRASALGLLTALARIRLKKRSIPIARWAVQVALFLTTSLLNNAAFGYDVPMSVHIIFRSGGLVVNMLMGWLVDGRRYNATQILSVILVTCGVACTTLSAAQPTPSRVSSPGHYSVGILILTLALIMSGFMGLAQDRAYARYGRGHWQEAMFYLHVLALPGFAFVWRDLASQIRAVHAGGGGGAGVEMRLGGLAGWLPGVLASRVSRGAGALRIVVPPFYGVLVLNGVTQLVCVAGVHRLTSRVHSLTVALVLVVRKAVSLGISVVLLQKSRGSGRLLWAGAGLVLVGTMGYAAGATRKADKVEKVRNE